MQTFKAEEINIENLFSNKLTYEIPNYQRPYSWWKDQVEKFCEDIIFAFENKEEYLLSSIILVEIEKHKKYEVIDWQQRLTTISIFLAVLKEFISDINKKDIDSRIFKDESTRVQRITTDKTKIHIFDNVLKNFNYEDLQLEVIKKEHKKNNYYLNAIYLYQYFESLSNDWFDFDSFYGFFMDSIYLIWVYTTNQSKAMRLFEVLNARWLPLKNSDLIKNFIIEKIYEQFESEALDDAKNKEENFSSRWKRMEEKMRDLNEDIEDLFTYFVYNKLWENPKKDLFEEFKLIYENQSSSLNDIFALIDEIDNLFNIYIDLFENKEDLVMYKKIHSMRHLKEGRFWKTILLTYLTENNWKKDLSYKELVNEVFRFYYLNWLARETVNPYKQLSFSIIKSIKSKTFVLPKDKYQDYIWADFSVNNLRSIFNVYFKDRSILEKVKKELTEDVYGEKRIKPLLLLIEYHLKEKESDRIYEVNDKKITVEHIYPQNSKDLNGDMKGLLNSIWNLTLLYNWKNASFSNLNFEWKKEKFKKSTNEFEITSELFDKYSSWSIDDLKEREKELLSYICTILNISL